MLIEHRRRLLGVRSACLVPVLPLQRAFDDLIALGTLGWLYSFWAIWLLEGNNFNWRQAGSAWASFFLSGISDIVRSTSARLFVSAASASADISTSRRPWAAFLAGWPTGSSETAKPAIRYQEQLSSNERHHSLKILNLT